MKNQVGNFNQNDKGETEAAMEMATVWERTKEGIDRASPRRELQQVRRVSQGDHSNDEPTYKVITQLPHPHGGLMKRFFTPPDKERADITPRVTDSPCDVTNIGKNISREGEGQDDGPASYLRRSYGSEDAPWKSTRGSSDDLWGVHHDEGGAASSDEDREEGEMDRRVGVGPSYDSFLRGGVGQSYDSFLRGGDCPSNDASQRGDDRAGEEEPLGEESLDEREKRIVYSKADEIINRDAGGGEDWLLSEAEGDEQPSGGVKQQSGEVKQQSGEVKQQSGEAKQQSGEVKQQSGEVKQHSAVRRRNLLDRRALNLSAGELHAFLKRDKYRLTKIKTRMRNVVYRYLYERARGGSQRGEKQNRSREASSMPHTHAMEAGEEAEANTEAKTRAEAKAGAKTGVASAQDVANLLYTECTIRRTNIAKLRNASKLVCHRRSDKCMQILSYNSVYVFDGRGGCSEDGSAGGSERGVIAGRVATASPPRGEAPPQRPPPSGRSPPTCRFTCNNHFVCLQRKEDEVHVFSHRVLSLNEFIFFKDKESKTTNEEKLNQFLDDLTCSGFERNCKRIELDWKAYPFYVIRDSSWKKINSIHVNVSNHLCICTETGSFVYQLFFTKETIQTKFAGSYFHRSEPLQKEKEIREAYLSSENRMIHVSHFNLFFLHRNSKLFKTDLFTIVKDIHFRQRILSVSFCGEWIILSFSNKVSVHQMGSGKVHFVLQINSHGDILGAEVTQKAAQVDDPPVTEATRLDTPQQKHCIPFLCPLQGENLFCLAYGRKITVLEHSSHITVRKQFMINHSVQLLRSVRDNILVTYGEKELHVFQLVYVKKEFSLVFFFKKGVRDAKCWKIHDGGNTFEVYEDAIKVNVKLIKINRDDEVARRIFYATNGGATKGGATKGGAPKGDATNGGATNGGATNGDTSHGGMALGDASIAPIGSTGAGAAGGAAHFYVNLLYIYVLDGERVDLVVVNSLVYLIYLLFSHHRYGLLLALMLHLYRGNCCVLTDLPVDEDERRDKLKPLIYFLFERRMNDIIKNGNKFGSNPRNSIYHVQVKDRQCDEDEEVKRRNGSNGFNNWCNHTSNKVLESVQAMGQSSESTFSASADQSMSESVSVALNGASFIDEEENGTEWPLSSHGGITSHGEGNPGGEELQHESRQILIDGRVISGNCIRELQKLCLLGIEISINFHMDLHECIFQFLRGVAAENFYFHLIEEYIVSKRIGITHDSVVFSLTEYFKRLYRIFSEYDDSCYDVFLFFCSLVGEPLNEERPNGERLNGKLLNGELLNEELLSEVVFSPLGESGDSSDEGVDGSGGEGGDERDCEGGEDPYDERDCERGEDPCADLDMHLYRHHLGAKNISRKIRRIYAFVCIVELFFRLFESISLEGEIEGIISHLPIHLSAFIYNKHNEDRITTAEFFISYLIRKKSNLFYSFCRCNSLRSDELPIYLPMYMFRNFYHCYFLFDYVFSVTFKVPFSISLNRFAVPLEEGITLRSCHSNVQAKYQFDDILNYGNIFFIFSPFRVERENHCTLNRTILSLWRYLLDGTHSRVGVSSVVGGSGVGVGSGVGGGSGVGVGSGADGGNSLEFLSPRRRSGDEGTCRRRNDPQRTQMNDYFNLDKNGFFLLLQLSLKDTFYLLNRSFFQYDYINNYDVINLLVRNLCNFYLHMVIIFLHYRMYLKKTLMQNLLEEETCVCIYGEVLLAVNTCRQYNEVSEVCLRLVHLIEEEGRHMHVHKNISNIVRWITLQLFYINKHREEMANSITYSLILFFILQSGCDDYSFDYLMGVHFVNFLLRLPCGGCQERRMSSTTGRRRFEKLTRRCFLFANKNYLKKIRPHVREERLFEAFRLKETNLRIRESQIKKNVEGTSSPQGNLVDYLLGEVYGVDVPGLLRQHGGDGGSGGGSGGVSGGDSGGGSGGISGGGSGEERTGERDHWSAPHGGVTRPVRRGDGCAFKRVRSRSSAGRSPRGTSTGGSVLPGGTSTGGSVPSGRVPSGGGPPRAGKTNKEQKQGDIFCVKFCRRHYGYILLLYVKKLLVLHRGGRSPGGEKREEGGPPKVHSEGSPPKVHAEGSPPRIHSQESPPKVHSKTAHHRLRRKNVEKLLKYILFFSSMRKCEPVYVIILNHFGRYDVVLDHYRTRKEWRSMEEYIFGNIFFFFKEKKMKRRLRGYLFYADVLEHVDVMSDILVDYILRNYFFFHNRTVRLLRGGVTPKELIRSITNSAMSKGDQKNQCRWGQTHLMSLCKLFTTTLIRCQNFSDLVKQRVYYLLLHEARVPSNIQRYLHKKIFYSYLTLLCKYKKDQVYRCVKYANVEKYKELFEHHGNVNVLLHLYERQGKLLNIIDLCLNLIKENILKLKEAFCREGDWFVPKDMTYGDVYAVKFCSRIDVYDLYAMPLKRSVRRLLLPRGGGTADQGEQRQQRQQPQPQPPQQDGSAGSGTERDSFLGKLLGRAHSAAERSAWGSYFVKTPRWGGKPQRNRPTGDANGTGTAQKPKRAGTVGDAKRALLAKACRIFLTREYNAVFLYTYMLTFVLRRNKLQSDRINEYVLFFIVNECVRGFIRVCEQLGWGVQESQRGEGCLLFGGDERHCTVSRKFRFSEKREEEEAEEEASPLPEAIAFFSYLFDQVVSFVINITSHQHAARICKKLLAKYRNFQMKLVRPPLIALLKNMTETYSLFSNNCHVSERRIKGQIEVYTFERKKGLVVDFHVDHTHPFNTKLCARSKRGGSAQPQHRPSQPSQPSLQEQEEPLPENCKDCTPRGDALWLSKCEHEHHFACSQRCHLCGASAEQSSKSVA